MEKSWNFNTVYSYNFFVKISWNQLILRLFFQVAAINTEAVDAFMSLSNLTHFYFGLITEWLDSMNALMSKEGTPQSKDSFPILVNGVVEMYTLSKLYKTLQTAFFRAQRVKILKMPKTAAKKQYIATMK